jgi:addiction module RelE/StbE family toxin
VKLAWAGPTRADRRNIHTRIAKDDPAAALKMNELFKRRAAGLVEHPDMGRPGRVPGTRELVVHPNYILIYDVAGDLVRVLRVLHAAQQWPLAGG